MTLTCKKKLVLLFTVLFSFSFVSTVNSELITQPPSYAAPYYNTSRYPYGGHPGNTVSEAIDNWWAAYKSYWDVSHCSYDLTFYDDGQITGRFAHMRLTNGCGGGDTIVETEYCDNGFTLIDDQCVAELSTKKNQGAAIPKQCP